MVKNKINEDILSELRDIKKENNEVQLEETSIPLIANTVKYKKDKVEKFKQYKLSIPKKYADDIQLNKEDFSAKLIYDKLNQKITIEITKNE